jgi:hypothetical protein
MIISDETIKLAFIQIMADAIEEKRYGDALLNSVMSYLVFREKKDNSIIKPALASLHVALDALRVECGLIPSPDKKEVMPTRLDGVNVTRIIAERKLLYSLRHDQRRKDCTIRLGAPYFVVRDAQPCSRCDIQIMGLNETLPDVYGADALQAVTFAANAIESLLQRLQDKYDFYHLSGNPYFDPSTAAN